MWLINTDSRELRLHQGKIPSYAILSHTWEGEEISFQEARKGLHDPHGPSIKGWRKIIGACEQAQRANLEWLWVDTCCIDKRSSAELTESINSMYQWYYNAAICYVYLSDLPGGHHVHFARRSPGASKDSYLRHTTESLKKCKWHTRGWTLQELLAPVEIEFFDGDWQPVGRKSELVTVLSEVTGIAEGALTDRQSLPEYSIAARMAWAAKRRTTRSEDMAYSLMGLFDVNMPLIYGEGGQNAFRRLQDSITQSSNDQSLFAWTPHVSDHRSLLFAPELSCFRNSDGITRLANSGQDWWTYGQSNYGLGITPRVRKEGPHLLCALNCTMPGHDSPLCLRVIPMEDAPGRGTLCRVDREGSLACLDPHTWMAGVMFASKQLTITTQPWSETSISLELQVDPRLTIFQIHPSEYWTPGKQ